MGYFSMDLISRPGCEVYGGPPLFPDHAARPRQRCVRRSDLLRSDRGRGAAGGRPARGGRCRRSRFITAKTRVAPRSRRGDDSNDEAVDVQIARPEREAHRYSHADARHDDDTGVLSCTRHPHRMAPQKRAKMK